MALFGQWRTDRDLQRKALAYVGRLMVEPDRADVDWLAERATSGDVDHAQWELRYARRALGLIAAQRDALDDRTASLAARELTDALARDPHVGPGKLEIAERQFNARLSAYREGLEARGGVGTVTRMGQTLIAFAGGSFRDADETVLRAGELLSRYLAEVHDSLRATFGAATLPEDLPPSALVQRR